jgi:hypothetical protein
MEDTGQTDILINRVELASELAHESAFTDMCNMGLITEEEEMWDGENYTERAQDIFNVAYDYYYDKITNCISK